MSHNDNIKIKFSGNDFFYVSSVLKDEEKPDESSCNELNGNADLTEGNCTINSEKNSSWITDFSGNCYKKEICKNKSLATEINNLENNHSGRDQNLINSKSIYSLELRRTISLSLGIIIIFGSIIYSKK
jgi:hypothetical protein